jgi:hypothetical protein
MSGPTTGLEVPEHILLQCATVLCASPEGFNTPGEEAEIADMDSFREVIGIAYRAGRDAALDRDEWRIKCRTSGGEETLPTVGSLQVARQGRDLMLANHYRNPWIEHRRVGATDWKRVD